MSGEAAERDRFVDVDWLTAAHRQLGAAGFREMLSRAAQTYGGPVGAVADALLSQVGLGDDTDIPLALAWGINSGSWSTHPGGPGAFRRLNSYWIARTLERATLEAFFHRQGFALPAESPTSLQDLHLIEPFTQSWFGSSDRVWACALSPDGQRLASISSDRTLKIWDAQSGTLAGSVDTHTGDAARDSSRGDLRDCVFTPDGQRVITIHANGALDMWNVETLSPVATYHVNRPWRWRVCAFGPDGLAAVAVDDDIHLVDARDLSRVAVLKGLGPSRCLAFAASGKFLWSYSETPCSLLTAWFVPKGQEIHVIEPQGWSTHPRVYMPTFTPDGRFFLAGNDQQLVVWSTATGARVAKAPYGVAGKALAIAPDGEHAATCDGEGNVRLWAIPTLTSLRTWNLRELGCRDLACALTFSPDGASLIVAEWTGIIRRLNCSSESKEGVGEEDDDVRYEDDPKRGGSTGGSGSGGAPAFAGVVKRVPRVPAPRHRQPVD